MLFSPGALASLCSALRRTSHSRSIRRPSHSNSTRHVEPAGGALPWWAMRRPMSEASRTYTRAPPSRPGNGRFITTRWYFRRSVGAGTSAAILRKRGGSARQHRPDADGDEADAGDELERLRPHEALDLRAENDAVNFPCASIQPTGEERNHGRRHWKERNPDETVVADRRDGLPTTLVGRERRYQRNGCHPAARRPRPSLDPRARSVAEGKDHLDLRHGPRRARGRREGPAAVPRAG